MKLNPKKCKFGMEEGMFLGYKIPDQISGKVATVFQNLEKVHEENRGSSKRCFDDGKGKKTNANLFCQPCFSWSLSKLHTNGKVGTGLVKGKILADFIVERPEDDSLATPMDVEEKLPDPCTLFTDGSSCIDGSRAGLIFTNPKGMKFAYALRFRFNATNNEAEYEALIARLRIVEKMGIKNLQTNVDSRLVVNQVNESYIVKEAGMIQYLEKVKTLASNFRKFLIKQVPRCENNMADTLSKIASTSFAHLTKQVLVEELNEISINEAEVLAVVEEEGDTWVTPIFEYLTEETLHAKK
ncbi:reverse transcriptase domain-containing protein [Tanacetum coccineum]